MKLPRRQWGYVQRTTFPNGTVEVDEQYPRFWTRRGAELRVADVREMLRSEYPDLNGITEYEVKKLGPLGPNPYMLPEAEYRQWCQEQDAAVRWQRHNAERRAAGCRCGKPATHVRYFGGTVGGVPAEVWTCVEHVNVNSWSSSDGGKTWEAGAHFDDAALAWEVR